MVGAEGFEPTTPASQTLCATRLRYAPMRGSIAEGGMLVKRLWVGSPVRALREAPLLALITSSELLNTFFINHWYSSSVPQITNRK